MRFFSFTALAALSATVIAQGLSDVPQCAQACFANSLGSCASTDFACICGNTAVIDKVSCCIFSTCPQADIATTTQLAASLCQLQNIQVNTAPSCASGSATMPGATGTAPAKGGSNTAASFQSIDNTFFFAAIVAWIFAGF